jgi:NAD(P)H-dependent FMN reductase
MQLLALSGSLRRESINSAFCRAVAKLARPPLSVRVYEGIGALPLFNPDLEVNVPESVRDLRTAVASADALLIASPEYAHGISGVLKNGLDWLVSFESAAYKPVAVVNTSSRATHAYAALIEVLATMSARIIREASLTVPLLGGCVTEEAMLQSPDVCNKIQISLLAIQNHLSGHPSAGPLFHLA